MKDVDVNVINTLQIEIIDKRRADATDVEVGQCRRQSYLHFKTCEESSPKALHKS